MIFILSDLEKGKLVSLSTSEILLTLKHSAFFNFLDCEKQSIGKNNIIISYIEICFECEAIRTSETKLNLGEYCSEKYDLIKSIFQEKNIKYGITEFN